MKQDIVIAEPPNIEAIDAAFQVRGKPIFYSYGDKIYNPSGNKIPPSLIAHEAVHGERQLAQGVDDWWMQYILNPQFRFDEELLAHRAEYRFLAQQPDAKKPVKGFRSLADYQLVHIAKRLSGPLYGGLVDFRQAMRLICAPS